jgi:hypothetical protein
MGNSTHSFFALNSVTNSANKQKTMTNQDQELSREEERSLHQTRKALDTIRFSPRPETLKAIAEYAKKAATPAK